MIHYHGTPIGANTAGVVQAMQRRHAMISFASQSQMDVLVEICQSFCFDNGAFTTWKTGKQFDIEGYAEFVEKWYRHPGFDFYLIPDVIDGDYNENLKMIGKWRNLIASYPGVFELGVPVWHLHEPLEVLANYVNAYPRVAIGSSGEYAVIGSNSWWQRMAQAMDVICDDKGRPKAKIHGLRMLDPKIFGAFPFSSADSTNMARNVGIDTHWKGTYQPMTKATRGIVLTERIEMSNSSAAWCKTANFNLELF